MKLPTLQEWMEALRQGEKVPLCRPQSLTVTRVVLAICILPPLVLLILGFVKGTASTVFPFVVLGFFGWAALGVVAALSVLRDYQAGKNAAVRLGPEGLVHWDARGREGQVLWGEITSLRVGLSKHSLFLVVAHTRGGRARKLSLRSDRPVQGSWQESSLPPVRALADAIAVRAGLVTERDQWGESTLLWNRPAESLTPQ